MSQQVVILHGWSDTSKSFKPLAEFLEANGYQAIPIWLGDYLSLEDDVKVEDVGRRMEQVVRELMAAGGLQTGFSLIVHSTGGLVAREWISAHYTGRIQDCPAKRLVMLAPANYGSPLAHKGQSMLGRVVKGWKNWFETGKEMLHSLELSSEYLWRLAFRDQFVPLGQAEAPALYHEGGVWPFVITGSHPYPKFLRQIVNENGGDGTVRVSGANLNTRGVTLDFSGDDATPTVIPWKLRHEHLYPFAVLPDRTHASIIDPEKSDIKSPQNFRNQLGALLIEALACGSWAQYGAIEAAWRGITEATASLAVDSTQMELVTGGSGNLEYFHQYLQINTRVLDDHGNEVKDYFLEFSGPDEEKGDASTLYFHRDVLESVHTNGHNPSRRCLYVDRSDLVPNFYNKLPARVAKVLKMSISATPPGDNVSYFEKPKTGAKGSVTVHQLAEEDEFSRWLKRNTTHFVEIIIPRTPQSGVFKLKRVM